MPAGPVPSSPVSTAAPFASADGQRIPEIDYSGPVPAADASASGGVILEGPPARVTVTALPGEIPGALIEAQPAVSLDAPHTPERDLDGPPPTAGASAGSGGTITQGAADLSAQSTLTAGGTLAPVADLHAASTLTAQGTFASAADLSSETTLTTGKPVSAGADLTTSTSLRAG